ncbi:hypothetical protein M432DRAFT_120792 [Thermoascus aurantiacus ATCC 26904]
MVCCLRLAPSVPRERTGGTPTAFHLCRIPPGQNLQHAEPLGPVPRPPVAILPLARGQAWLCQRSTPVNDNGSVLRPYLPVPRNPGQADDTWRSRGGVRPPLAWASQRPRGALGGAGIPRRASSTAQRRGRRPVGLLAGQLQTPGPGREQWLWPVHIRPASSPPVASFRSFLRKSDAHFHRLSTSPSVVLIHSFDHIRIDQLSLLHGLLDNWLFYIRRTIQVHLSTETSTALALQNEWV